MSKKNIVFNGITYQVEESSLAPAAAELRTHLSTTMSGSGAAINFGGTSYNIDSEKLSTARNEFTTHLRAISGNGHKVSVGGVEYGVDSSKLTSAISEIEAVLAGTGEERLEGDGAEYYTLAPTALSFRSTAPLNELQEIQINGVTVDPSNYTLEEGSTIVTFPIDYLKTLNVGSYEVAVASDSKTVKGDFSVKAPELNEHGFYYNQPYTAYVDVFGGNTAVFIRNNNTLDLIVTDNGYVETCSYTITDNQLVITGVMGTFTVSFSNNGNEAFVNELYTSFVLGDEHIVADGDYIYIYKEELGGYAVNVIDKTKSEYSAIKTGINGIDTVALNNDAFYDCDALTSINIPDSVTSIGEYAFHDCDALTSINIPDSVTSIGEYAFYDCDALTSVTIGNSVTSIGEYAFEYCDALTSVTIGNSVTSIGDYAFDNCKALTSINIPDSVTTIGASAFDNCDALTSVTLGDSVTTIGASAFDNCKALTSVTLGDSVTTIGKYAFSNCTSLTSINIPDSVTSIEYDAFSYCYALTSINIPDSVTSIEYDAFFNCTSLTSITFAGTMAQWNLITKGDYWNKNVPATYVQCSDGQVAL